MDEFERTVAELETLFEDPGFKKAVDEVLLVNDLLRDEPTSEDDARAIIKDLNERWREAGYRNKEMFVTGSVSIGGTGDTVEYGDINTASATQFNDYPFISDGFRMIISPEERDGVLSISQEVIMTGRIEYDDESEYSVEGKSNDVCSIRLVPETHIEFKKMTASKAAAWLELYYPDTKRAIDQYAVYADNECEMTEDLRDNPLPPADQNPKEARMQKRAIQTYIDSVVSYERFVPYLVELFGECELYDAHEMTWEKKSIMSNVKSMVVIDSLVVKIDKQSRDFHFSFRGWLLSSNKTEATLMKLPLQTIISMESGRELLRPKKIV